MSELCGISEITIRQYEANKYKPKYDSLKKLAAALGCSTACLRGEVDDPDLDSIDDAIPPGMPDNGRWYTFKYNGREYVTADAAKCRKARNIIEFIKYMDETNNDTAERYFDILFNE